MASRLSETGASIFGDSSEGDGLKPDLAAVTFWLSTLLAQHWYFFDLANFFVIHSWLEELLPDLKFWCLTRCISIERGFATLPLCPAGAEKNESTVNVRPGGYKNRGKKNLPAS